MELNEILGWFGTILLLAAYFLVSRKVFDSEGSPYNLMNLIGAFF